MPQQPPEIAGRPAVSREVLNVRGLSAGYGPMRVIHDLDLVVNAGERVGIVGRNGQAIESIARQISGMNGVIVGIADGAREQTANLKQINDAVTEMERSTQANVSVVEQTTNAARSLAQQTDLLAQSVAQFQLEDEPRESRRRVANG